MGTHETQALYDRLGGVYAIAVVVDDFIDRVMTDARLNANPRVDEAHHRVSPQGFKYYVTEMLCWAAGGPQTYSGPDGREPRAPAYHGRRVGRVHGRPRPDAHHVRRARAEARGEVVAIVESTRHDIVTAAPAAA
jgi:hemoglobin